MSAPNWVSIYFPETIKRKFLVSSVYSNIKTSGPFSFLYLLVTLSQLSSPLFVFILLFHPFLTFFLPHLNHYFNPNHKNMIPNPAAIFSTVTRVLLALHIFCLNYFFHETSPQKTNLPSIVTWQHIPALYSC